MVAVAAAQRLDPFLMLDENKSLYFDSECSRMRLFSGANYDVSIKQSLNNAFIMTGIMMPIFHI